MNIKHMHVYIVVVYGHSHDVGSSGVCGGESHIEAVIIDDVDRAHDVANGVVGPAVDWVEIQDWVDGVEQPPVR